MTKDSAATEKVAGADDVEPLRWIDRIGWMGGWMDVFVDKDEWR